MKIFKFFKNIKFRIDQFIKEKLSRKLPLLSCILGFVLFFLYDYF